METIQSMLAGGHPNSLGRTVEVVGVILKDRAKLRELLDCYKSEDEVVRLRVSNALKRIEGERHDWLLPHLDELIDDVGRLDQASAQWTLAQLFDRYAVELSTGQRSRALALMKRNIEHHNDWIVLNHTLETLSRWAKEDAVLKAWLKPQAERLAREPRKSIAGRARKKLRELYGA
jgi:hypothetical protein